MIVGLAPKVYVESSDAQVYLKSHKLLNSKPHWTCSISSSLRRISIHLHHCPIQFFRLFTEALISYQVLQVSFTGNFQLTIRLTQVMMATLTWQGGKENKLNSRTFRDLNNLMCTIRSSFILKSLISKIFSYFVNWHNANLCWCNHNLVKYYLKAQQHSFQQG